MIDPGCPGVVIVHAERMPVTGVVDFPCLGGNADVRMKSYFANSVQLAMEQAGRELGSDATLVTSQSTGPDARHLGEYEVVFATELPEALAFCKQELGVRTITQIYGEPASGKSTLALIARVACLRHSPVTASGCRGLDAGRDSRSRATIPLLATSQHAICRSARLDYREP